MLPFTTEEFYAVFARYNAVPMLIGPAIGDTDPIRRTSPSPGGQLHG